MIVKDLVETRELLTDETNGNVFVVYERFDNVDCHCEGQNIEEIECDPEEQVQILQGDPESSSSLKSVKTYLVGETFPSIDAIVQDIRLNYTELFQ
ncbi:hypothetical protein [Salipaludibacillus daqingensis]|uniref:hypothetical protein n=1 Tax=Salipaludibacillus daqingensis TaxID=3041001 RepID=UPI002472F48A|nr:hypothetical protein [Salipaludibacillus daqingensis]